MEAFRSSMETTERKARNLLPPASPVSRTESTFTVSILFGFLRYNTVGLLDAIG